MSPPSNLYQPLDAGASEIRLSNLPTDDPACASNHTMPRPRSARSGPAPSASTRTMWAGSTTAMYKLGKKMGQDILQTPWVMIMLDTIQRLPAMEAVLGVLVREQGTRLLVARPREARRQRDNLVTRSKRNTATARTRANTSTRYPRWRPGWGSFIRWTTARRPRTSSIGYGFQYSGSKGTSSYCLTAFASRRTASLNTVPAHTAVPPGSLIWAGHL